ncbi:DUF2076 domain-containing protein, partial [Pseudomonas helleri]|uniref:DUF2076 domain-containing protein n=1 Tax=Pseudomonas helleri TaxID=1608996 RepID=UPI001E50992A
MNSEEQTLIDGLFTRLQQAEREAAPRDAQAQSLINEHIARQPLAPYFMTHRHHRVGVFRDQRKAQLLEQEQRPH